jgi:hypothetical protein
MERENDSSPELLYEEEYKKQHESHFVFWFQAHNQSMNL